MSEEKKFNYGFSTNIGIEDIGFIEGSEVNGHRQYRVEMDIESMHINGHGTLHGGVIATLMDACMARVFFLSIPGQNPDNPIGGVTVEMKTTFVKGVREGRVYALGTLLKQGKRTAFTEGELFNEQGELLAKASATMMISTPRT